MCVCVCEWTRSVFGYFNIGRLTRQMYESECCCCWGDARLYEPFCVHLAFGLSFSLSLSLSLSLDTLYSTEFDRFVVLLLLLSMLNKNRSSGRLCLCRSYTGFPVLFFFLFSFFQAIESPSRVHTCPHSCVSFEKCASFFRIHSSTYKQFPKKII